MGDSTVEFSKLCFMFDRVVRAKKGVMKRKHVRTFLDKEYTDHKYFSVLRLMLPGLDKERATYGLKEAVLGKFLAKALCLSKDSEDAKRLTNWRKGGSSAGSNAGNFSFIAFEILYSRQAVASKGVKIKDVNDMLDRLANADRKNDEKSAVLADMISKTNSDEMRWIIMIILKDLKLGISEKTIFGEFHPDAEHVFNVTCDLKLLCEKLSDRTKRFNRQDIEVGKAVRPQLAGRVANVEEAWKKFRGKEVVVECKFDGDRIQVHKDGNHVKFFSRNFNDHQHFKEGMAEVLIQNILPDKCILDGELLVWNKLKNRFAEFGGNREAAKAAKEGQETDLQLCYVAFDLLYYDSTSVIHLSLRERQQQLSKAVRPVKGRLELLYPGAGLDSHRNPGEPNWSIFAKNVDEVQRFFQDTIENREEGIILKDLDSKWEPDDRSGKWLKLKPDYINTGSDLDVLIIGGYYGSGRRGGLVSQFLLGIAERPKGSDYPTKFLSFCRVGTGMTDEERNRLVEKISPYFRRNENKSRPPHCYTVTNNAKERPDVWVGQPDKSVILQIRCDIRTIDTDVFAAPYGLRFPRVERIRYEKPWYDCLDVQTLLDIVDGGKGKAVDLKGYGQFDKKSKQNKRLKKADIHPSSLVPSHMLVTDVTHVQRKSQIFSDLVFYFVNYPEEHAKESLHKLVAENGASFSMNLNDDVTHAIASERRGIKYQASCAHGDVIHYSWIIDCCTSKTLLPVRPKYFLHLSTHTKEKMAADIDNYGDYYFVDIDTSDLSQLFQTMDSKKLATHSDQLAHYKMKYCPSPAFSIFADHFIYFHKPVHSSNPDSQMVAEVTLKRQELEVSMLGGAVSGTLNSSVTHMIVFTSSLQAIPFKTIFKSVAQEDRKLLMSAKLKVLSHQWIDDCLLRTSEIPTTETYELRDTGSKLNGTEEAGFSLIAETAEGSAENRLDDSREVKTGRDYDRSIAVVEVPAKSSPAQSRQNRQKIELQTNSVEVKGNDAKTKIEPQCFTNDNASSGVSQVPGSQVDTSRLPISRDLPRKRLVTVEPPSKRKRPRRGADTADTTSKTHKVREARRKVKTEAEENKSPTRAISSKADIAITSTGPTDCEVGANSAQMEVDQFTCGDGGGCGDGKGLGRAVPTQAPINRAGLCTDDDPLDAIMGEMFPVFKRSQLYPSTPDHHDSSEHLDPHQASNSAQTRSKDATVAGKSDFETSPPKPGSRVIEKDEGSAAEPVPAQVTPKVKVSYKNLVKSLLEQ